MGDVELANQTRETAQGIVNNILTARKRGNTKLEAILIRTFHTLSNIHKKAVGKGLIVNETWTVEAEA